MVVIMATLVITCVVMATLVATCVVMATFVVTCVVMATFTEICLTAIFYIYKSRDHVTGTRKSVRYTKVFVSTRENGASRVTSSF